MEQGAPLTSVSTVAFDGYPLPVALAAIARCGAHYVEPAYIEGYGNFDETAFSAAAAGTFRAELRQAGLLSFAVSAHIDLGREDAPERLRRRLGFAGEIGANILITNAGRRDARDAVMRTVEGVLPFCLASGLVLALENPGHGTDALFGRGDEGAALAQAFACPALGLNYDAGNVLTYSGGERQPARDFADTLRFTVHSHLKDVAAVDGDWVFTSLGDGQVGLDTLVPMLRDAKLPVGIELPLRLHRPGRADPVRKPHPIPLHHIERAVTSSLVRLGHH